MGLGGLPPCYGIPLEYIWFSSSFLRFLFLIGIELTQLLSHLADEFNEHFAVTLVRQANVELPDEFATFELHGAFAMLFQVHVLFLFCTTQVSCPETTLVRAVVSDSETLEALATLRVLARFLAAFAHHCHLCANAVTVGSRSHNLSPEI